MTGGKQFLSLENRISNFNTCRLVGPNFQLNRMDFFFCWFPLEKKKNYVRLGKFNYMWSMQYVQHPLKRHSCYSLLTVIKIDDRNNDCYCSCLCFNYGHCQCGATLCTHFSIIPNVATVLHTENYYPYSTHHNCFKSMLILFKLNWNGAQSKRTLTRQEKTTTNKK